MSKYLSDKYTLEVCEAGGRGSAFCDKSQMLLSRTTAAPKLITLNLPKICKPQRSHWALVTKSLPKVCKLQKYDLVFFTKKTHNLML